MIGGRDYALNAVQARRPMTSPEQPTNATFIIRFFSELRGGRDGVGEWRVRLEHVESREQFHCRTFDQVLAVFESYGFTDTTRSAPTLLRRIADGFRRRLGNWRR